MNDGYKRFITLIFIIIICISIGDSILGILNIQISYSNFMVGLATGAIIVVYEYETKMVEVKW